MEAATIDRPWWRRPLGLWVVWSFVPFGWGTWVGFLIAGLRAQQRRWVAYSVLWALAAVGTIVWTEGYTIIALWAAGLASSFVVRPVYARRMRGGPVDAARRRLRERHEALEMATAEPALALEAGVGRPDVPGAAHAGVVDVNHAPADVIERLPGIDRASAERLVAAREEVDGFSSLEDLGAVLDLPGDRVEDLRGLVVFLPR